MNTVVINEVRPGFYLDSVALMQISAELAALPGVEDAVAMIGTPSNLEIVREAGLLVARGEAAGPNDLVVAVRATDATAVESALSHARGALEREIAPVEDGDWRPRTLDGALDAIAGANLALVSTPGTYAAREARRALDRGLNVMLFSDNVPLESERALKERAHALGLLVMGPDCGTAYIAGTPLAFANVVPRGRVGVIAASGTGLQEVSVLLARAGAGISHGIGVGGRDLSDAVGGLSTLDAIDLLASDEGTDHLILVSKPPGPLTARAVFKRLAAAGKPCTAVVFGADGAEMPRGGPLLAPTLKDAVEHATGCPVAPEYDAGTVAQCAKARLSTGRRAVRGLFCGGTLATEAHAVLAAAGLDVASNPAPAATRHSSAAPGATRADYDITSSIAPAAMFGSNARHAVMDLGADEYTVGRPHPMIDPVIRTARLREALAEPGVAVVLLDVVLGFGAHPDPARPICDAIRDANGDVPVVVASICGTRDDPQDRGRQAAMLGAAGVVVAPSNADAATVAAEIVNHVDHFNHRHGC